MFKKFYLVVKILFLVLAVCGGVLFFGSGKAKAAEPQSVVINELMWMGSSALPSDEWIELRNMTGNAIDLSGWQLTKNTGTETLMITIPSNKIIAAHGYIVISHYDQDQSNLATIPDIVNSSVSLSNSNLQIKLFGNTSNLIDTAGDGKTPLRGSNISPKAAMERNLNPGDGTKTENWHTAVDSIGFDSGVLEKGTPGSENSSVPIKIPNLISPEDGKIFIGNISFNFEWKEEQDLYYKLIVSKNLNLSNPISDINNLDLGKYYWGILVSNDRTFKQFGPWSFELKEVVYSEKIIINEISPHPENGTGYEFIELYNSGDMEADLSGWILDDNEGGSTPYTIPAGTIISSGKYLAFYRSVTGITLNDSGGDAARLFNPNDELVSSVFYTDYASLGLSWALGPDGWGWTDTPTAGAENIIHLPENTVINSIDDNQPVNSEPIEIGTGDFASFENYLVTVMGEVVETSGDTFYLDDGSGRVKIYIQKKTGIDKPEMHKGDIFLITGIVDLYGTTWRILPRTIDDIKLVESHVTITKNATKKKTVTTAKKVLSNLSGKNIVGDVKAASSENNNANKNSSKVSFWYQFIKLITSLSVIFLVLLVVKVLRSPKPKIIGGNFGEDET